MINENTLGDCAVAEPMKYAVLMRDAAMGLSATERHAIAPT